MNRLLNYLLKLRELREENKKLRAEIIALKQYVLELDRELQGAKDNGQR